LLAASHASCYAIALRSVIGRKGGAAARILVTATVTAEKGPDGVRIRASHLTAHVHGLSALDESALADAAEIARRDCTISNAIGGSVRVSHEVASSTP
jgi:osmotically inducible protein OsmC